MGCILKFRSPNLYTVIIVIKKKKKEKKKKEKREDKGFRFFHDYAIIQASFI